MRNEGASQGAAILHELAGRRSVAPLHLTEPGPSPGELRALLAVAARVPDHGALVPWRFITVTGADRQVLSSGLAKAYLAAQPSPSSEAALKTSDRIEKVFARPPTIVFVVSSPKPDTGIPEVEQILSAGAVCMALLVAVRAMGFSANWLTGFAAANLAARTLIGLTEAERLAGFIPIGTYRGEVSDRPRPSLEAIVASWLPEHAASGCRA
jgi:nitroreductase